MSNLKHEIITNCINDMIDLYEEICLTAERKGRSAVEHDFLLKLLYEYARIKNIQTKKQVSLKLSKTQQQKLIQSYKDCKANIKALKKQSYLGESYIDEYRFILKIIQEIAEEYQIKLT